jgi:hypothetical protein
MRARIAASKRSFTAGLGGVSVIEWRGRVVGTRSV